METLAGTQVGELSGLAGSSRYEVSTQLVEGSSEHLTWEWEGMTSSSGIGIT